MKTENTAEEIPRAIEVSLGDLAGKLGAVRGIERAILID
jgi:hypothetical protein